MMSAKFRTGRDGRTICGMTARIVAALFMSFAAVSLTGAPAHAQQTATSRPKDAGPSLSFPTPEAAIEAFVAAVRDDNEAQLARLLGTDFRKFAPRPENSAELRQAFLEAYGKAHKLVAKGDQMILEAGTDGWTLSVPLVKGASGWMFDIVAGAKELRIRATGRNELATIQAMLAIVDAQQDYAAMDPMKTGTTQFARRLLSTPGRKDGLYWEQGPDNLESPLGDFLAKAQIGSAFQREGYFGYRYRLLYAQGAHAKGGVRDYIVRNRMIGGFAAIAAPVRYGETGVMTFIVNQDGVVYEKDFGPDTERLANEILTFNPDESWSKADTTP
jgi:hypothetical protein